ncbi:MAG: PilZ domain-containing protein [Acidobacteriia bacterium]|nr:PilZ domain-containing protein [Terriglobia bacterium]
MTFQALLVSKDEEAAAVLTPVLAGFGVTVVSCGYPDGICQLTEQKFDAVLADFDDPHSAELVLQNVFQSSSGNRIVTVALLSDKAKVRNVFGKGANFVLYKPLSPEQAEAGLRAATALIKRERRSSYRVPVQVPVQLKVQDGPEMEGILLDLSEEGMDLLAAQALCPSAPISVRFSLPAGQPEIEVRGEIAWANPNGQAGVRFAELGESLRTTIKAWVAANAPQLPPLDPEPVTQCKLTDLSLGGCYVQTESPFPERSGITLGLRAEGMEAQVDGRVRVMHPGFGMGIEFPAHTADERAQVARFIGFLTSRPGTVPELLITPRALTATSASDDANSTSDQLDDPLLELLRRHESLSQEEFLQELQKQRSSEEVAPA